MSTDCQTNFWTAKQAYITALICLVLGIAVGYLARGPSLPAASTHAAISPPAMGKPAAMAPPLNEQLSPAEMKAASKQAATAVLERLKTDPSNFKLLVEAGEMYYHHGAYAEAATYYARALEVQDNIPVRNQYARALFYYGDADGALRQYATVLKTNPTNDIALFNSGMIKLKAKGDANGAVELWRKLLAAYPNHPQRDRVQEMIERASNR